MTQILSQWKMWFIVRIQYIEQKNESQAVLYASKIIELFGANKNAFPSYNLNLVEAFIGLRMFNYVCVLSDQYIKANGVRDFFEKLDFLLIKSYKYLLSCKSISESVLFKEVENLNTKGIRFLVETGDLKKAKEMADKMDLKNDNCINNDTYYFYLGNKYLNESSNRILKFVSLNLAHKIKDTDKKIYLMTKIAVDFHKNSENDIFLKIMNDISKLAGEENVKFSWNKKDLAMIWLEAGYPDKSMELIESIKDKFYRSINLYKFGVYALTNYNNKPLAENVLHKFEYNSVFKGLLLSKIAAWHLVQEDNKKGVELFVDALEIMKKNEDSEISKIQGFSFIDYIPIFIKDYITAKVQGRICGIENDKF